MSTKWRPILRDDIRRAYDGDAGSPCPPIVTPAQLAAALGLSVKTVYLWIQQGRLDGAFRKRDKHVLFWRDRVLDILFNGSEWKNDK